MLLQKVFSIWLLLNATALLLPLYKTNLQDKKVFEIASDNTDYDEQSENEMIQPADLTNLNLYIEDESRYKPLHSYVDSYNKREVMNKAQHTNTFFHLKFKTWESSDTEKNDTSFIAGFKEDLNKVLRKTKIQNLYKKSFQPKYDYKQNNNFFLKISNDVADINNNIKRSISPNIIFEENKYTDNTGEEAYDYDQFKREYEEQIEKNINSHKVQNFTDEEKLGEHPKEVLQKLVDFKNCTETNGTFGIKSIDCLMHNYEQQKNKTIVKKTLQKIWLTIKIWILIYICLAIPCWCQKGWCCCCFRCKFCFPHKRILFAKQYYANNPPGILKTHVQRKEEEKPIMYAVTELEANMYEKLETTIRNI